MKVFISWSGETSHHVAKVLRDWLPAVIQSIDPYVSSEDIDKGSRWSTDIAKELEDSAYGILCVTKGNLNAPWLNFEAGALGKSVDKSRVCPFLFRVKRSEIQGPLLQFQSTIQEKEDLWKLLRSLNTACSEEGISEERLQKAFDVWWSELQSNLDAIKEIEEAESQTPQKVKKGTAKPDELSPILEEILELSRTNQKLLRNPEQIVPPEYFEYLMDRFDRPKRRRGENLHDIDPLAFEEVIKRYRDLLKKTEEVRNREFDQRDFEDILELIRSLDRPMRYIVNANGMRLPRGPLDINI